MSFPLKEIYSGSGSYQPRVLTDGENEWQWNRSHGIEKSEVACIHNFSSSPLPLKIKQQKGPSGTGNTENVICNQELIVKS